MSRLRSPSGRLLAAALATAVRAALLAGARAAAQTGISSSTVRATIGRLRSGPYYLLFSSTARSARPVACGHIF